MVRHFLDIKDIDLKDLNIILEDAAKRKKEGLIDKPLTDKTLAMIFEKNSTRTRVSFEVGMKQMGGNTIVLSSRDMQLGRGESIADTAEVLSRYVDAIMYRTSGHQKIVDLATSASIPVINALTDQSHPCQIMADLLTMMEHKGSLKGKKVAWSAPGNNVARSWAEAADKFGFSFYLASPEGFMLPDEGIKNLTKTTDPIEAVTDADIIVTDTWFSMGEDVKDERRKILAPYQVTTDLMKHAKSDAIFMHCLPAHRGEEVADNVIDGEQSVIFDEAENRLHVQKSILAWCLGAI
ncbi:MAG: ornithine carbamoyltransferase [Alphaproteobacteria bacterium]